VKKGNKSEALISVCLVTYNHVNYIAQAIEGVLMQQTTFPWELIIADDCSTDGSRSILLRYQEQYPHIIKLILQEKNIGAYRNWMDLIYAAKSKYIAYLDGDDYWTDASKLEKQVKFLELNSDYAICAHRVMQLEDNVLKTKPDLLSSQVLTIEDLAKGNILATLSVVYRNNLIEKFPTWLSVSPLGDYVLHMLNAKKGDIMIFNEVMGVYRIHEGGAWSTMTEINLFEKMMRVLSFLLTEDFEEKVVAQLKIQKRYNATRYLRILMETNQQLFKDKLQELVSEDPQLGNEWLFDYLPNYIFWLKSSKTFSLAKKISKWLQKLNSFSLNRLTNGDEG
jgi:glycosyltransferase involved in cell wall biosynthesis